MPRRPNRINLAGAIARSYEKGKKTGHVTSVASLADDIDHPFYLLQKAFDCSDPGSLPLSKLVLFMRSVGNYIVLHFLARKCGYVLFKIPRPAAAVYDKIPDLQNANKKTITALHKYYAGEISLAKLHIIIDENIGHLAAQRKGAEKKDSDEQAFLFDPEEDE